MLKKYDSEAAKNSPRNKAFRRDCQYGRWWRTTNMLLRAIERHVKTNGYDSKYDKKTLELLHLSAALGRKIDARLDRKLVNAPAI